MELMAFRTYHHHSYIPPPRLLLTRSCSATAGPTFDPLAGYVRLTDRVRYSITSVGVFAAMVTFPSISIKTRGNWGNIRIIRNFTATPFKVSLPNTLPASPEQTGCYRMAPNVSSTATILPFHCNCGCSAIADQYSIHWLRL
jgi:hypothetical protein